MRHPVGLVAVMALAATLPSLAKAQSRPMAQAGDVESIDAIIAAVYDVISGPAGEKRDWDRFLSLFTPEARLIPTGARDSANTYRPISPENYVANVGPNLEGNGFFEVEASRVTEQFGHIAHAFSTYESRRNAEDAQPFARGINSFQLFNDGSRWWVMNIMWTNETPALPIPQKYLAR